MSAEHRAGALSVLLSLCLTLLWRCRLALDGNSEEEATEESGFTRRLYIKREWGEGKPTKEGSLVHRNTGLGKVSISRSLASERGLSEMFSRERHEEEQIVSCSQSDGYLHLGP